MLFDAPWKFYDKLKHAVQRFDGANIKCGDVNRLQVKTQKSSVQAVFVHHIVHIGI